MNNYIEKQKLLFEKEISFLNETITSKEKLEAITVAVGRTLKALKDFISENKFGNDAEEIQFFKTVKPEITAMRIEAIFRYKLAANKPIGTTELQLKFYEDEINAIQSFFMMHAFYYQYYKNALTTLDGDLFLRSEAQPLLPIDEIDETDKTFSTPYSQLLARFKAYERVQYYIVEQITAIKYPEMIKASGGATNLKWTGDSINVVELAYGIWLTGQLNNGNASLNQIVQWLEKDLQVSVGRPHRRFIEIERRKRLSVTKFLDHMREAVINKVDEKNQ